MKIIYFPSKFQQESGTGDTVSLQYSTITDVYTVVIQYSIN